MMSKSVVFGQHHHLKALVSITSFSAWLFLIFIVTDWKMSQESYRYIDSSYYEKEQALIGFASQLHNCSEDGGEFGIFMGSSRTELGFDANKYDSLLRDYCTYSFNFGLPGAGPVMQYIYIKRILSTICQPQIVMLEIHPAMFADSDLVFEARWMDQDRLSAVEQLQNEKYGLTRLNTKRHEHLLGTPVLLKHRLSLLNEFEPRLLPSRNRITIGVKQDNQGFVATGQLSPALSRKATDVQLKIYEPAFQKQTTHRRATEALVDTIDYLQAYHVSVRLVVSPESTSFRSNYKSSYLENFHDMIDSVCILKNVSVIDASDFVSDEFFPDGHHMNAEGANEFAYKLANAVHKGICR